MFILQETQPSEVPAEFIRSAFAHLDAAEKLNFEMITGQWEGSYQRGQVVMWLTFHATELFLKGFNLKANPESKVNGHTLPKLKDQLQKKVGPVEFNLPFGCEALEEYRDFIQQYDQSVHERFRYPTDKKGAPWSGVVGFTPNLFATTLTTLRLQAEKLQAKLASQ